MKYSDLKTRRWDKSLEKPQLDYSEFFMEDVGQVGLHSAALPVCVCVSAALEPAALTVCVCVCVCTGPWFDGVADRELCADAGGGCVPWEVL